MIKRAILFLVITTVVCANIFAQTPNIENYLQMIESGQAELVKAELPSLLAQYPNNPGVLYVQAVLTTDGAEAVRMYQSIVDNYPKSEWADDALFKVYKFYEAIGLNRTAELKLIQLKTNYPDSKYAPATSSTEPPQVAEEKIQSPPPATTSTQEPTPKVEETPKQSEVVQQEPPKPEPPKAETVKPAPTASGTFALQVGVYSTRANADRQKMFFEYQQYSAEVVSKMKGSKELFAVFVGNFATADEAKIKGNEIRNSFHIDSIVVTR